MNPKKGMIVKSTLGAVYEVLSVENGRVRYKAIATSLFPESSIDSISIEDWISSSASDIILSPGID